MKLNWRLQVSSTLLIHDPRTILAVSLRRSTDLPTPNTHFSAMLQNWEGSHRKGVSDIIIVEHLKQPSKSAIGKDDIRGIPTATEA